MTIYYPGSKIGKDRLQQEFVETQEYKMYYIVTSTNIDMIFIEQLKQNYVNIYKKVDNVEKIYTIGYEGKTSDEFIKELEKTQISIVIDVRENPNSRKKGFSKKILAETLSEKGIQYKHIAELGTPKDIRLEYKNNGDIERLLNQYRIYLDENPEYIEKLLDAIGNNSACLLCFEKYAAKCHRFIISEYLYLNQGMAIKHL